MLGNRVGRVGLATVFDKVQNKDIFRKLRLAFEVGRHGVHLRVGICEKQKLVCRISWIDSTNESIAYHLDRERLEPSRADPRNKRARCIA